MTVSEFCRRAVFGTTPKQRLTAEQTELLKDVRKFRLDLDRISNHWRTGAWPEVRDGLAATIEKLKQLLRHDSKL